MAVAPDARAAPGGTWPRTTRFLPWLIAAFLAMVWLVPFDSMQLRLNVPVDPKLDRLAIGGIALLWMAAIFAGGRLSPRWRRDPIETLLLVFVALAIASVVFNGAVLAREDQVDEAIKKLALLCSYVVFFLVVTTTVRAAEAYRLLLLFYALAVIAATVVLVQYFSGRNLFFDLFTAITPEGAIEFRRVGGNSRFVAPPVTGPTRHALALAAMLAMALSVGVALLLRSGDVRARVLRALGVVVILGGIFATSRKTGTFAGAAVILVLTALRPTQMIKLVPVAAVALALALIYAPAAVETQLRQIAPGTVTSGASGEARSADYEAIGPDVRQRLPLGRGWGTYEPDRYRILDNNYLGLLLETGVLGLAGFVALMLAVPWRARAVINGGDPLLAAVALASAGAAGAMIVAMALFDALSFAQVPYLFLFLAGLVVVARSPEQGAPSGLRVAPPPRPAGEPAAR